MAFKAVPAESGVASSAAEERRVYQAIKRLLDVFGAVVGLILSSPILLLSAVLIKLDDRGPILHRRVVLARGGHFPPRSFEP
jgi:lipopolysaccharide/colanic/teichoic acid biosynthesis glycosyltransferase